MNQLISLRSNIYYTKDEKGNFNRVNEVIFLLDEPKYERTTEGEIIRQRRVKEVRFTIRSESEKSFIEAVQNIFMVKEEDIE